LVNGFVEELVVDDDAVITPVLEEERVWRHDLSPSLMSGQRTVLGDPIPPMAGVHRSSSVTPTRLLISEWTISVTRTLQKMVTPRPAKASKYTRTRNRYSERVTASPACNTTTPVEINSEGIGG
jgi:hypothetical protein